MPLTCLAASISSSKTPKETFFFPRKHPILASHLPGLPDTPLYLERPLAKALLLRRMCATSSSCVKSLT